MRSHLTSLLAGLLLVVGAVSPAAVAAMAEGTGDARTPEELVVEYSAKIPEGDFLGFAETLHPEELLEFQQSLLPLYDMAEDSDQSAGFMMVFAGGRSLEEIRAASPAEFLAIFLEAIMKIEPAVGEALGGMKMVPIGTVRESTDEGEVAHVVVRTTTSTMGIEIEQIDTVSLRQHEGTWKMMLAGEIQAMAKAIAAQLGLDAEEPSEEPAEAPSDAAATDGKGARLTGKGP